MEFHGTHGSGEARQSQEILSVCSEQGGRRYQEDRFVAETVQAEGSNLQVLAVMDGHGGFETAQYIANKLVPAIQSTYESGQDTKQNLKNVFSQLNDCTSEEESGSTLSVVLVPDGQQKAYVAILGDSPVIIGGSGDVNVSPEHNARSNLEDRERAIEKGAAYNGQGLIDPRTGGGLQLSRALGDKDYGYFLNREPEVYSVDLTGDSFILVATDGVLDPSHKSTSEDAARVAEMIKSGADAESVVQDALSRGNRDNATAVLWRKSPQV